MLRNKNNVESQAATGKFADEFNREKNPNHDGCTKWTEWTVIPRRKCVGSFTGSFAASCWRITSWINSWSSFMFRSKSHATAKFSWARERNIWSDRGGCSLRIEWSQIFEEKFWYLEGSRCLPWKQILTFRRSSCTSHVSRISCSSRCCLFRKVKPFSKTTEISSVKNSWKGRRRSEMFVPRWRLEKENWT